MPNTSNSNCHPLVVATWNYNGIREKAEELLRFLEEEDVSILIASEALLKPHVKQGLRRFQC